LWGDNFEGSSPYHESGIKGSETSFAAIFQSITARYFHHCLAILSGCDGVKRTKKPSQFSTAQCRRECFIPRIIFIACERGKIRKKPEKMKKQPEPSEPEHNANTIKVLYLTPLMEVHMNFMSFCAN
jgi:hypothetical protein